MVGVACYGAMSLLPSVDTTKMISFFPYQISVLIISAYGIPFI